MKVAFFSNYLNHHQLPFSEAMIALTENQYTFVATETIPQFRLNLGYHNMNDEYDFVLKTYESKENELRALNLAEECDVVIIGSAPSWFVQKRIIYGKLTFFYSERLYKQGFFSFINPKKLGGIKVLFPNFLCLKNTWLWNSHGQYKQYPNVKLLCASMFTAGDMRLSGLYKNKSFKWGYFPKVLEYNIDELISAKNPVKILWVGRLIKWKHPEVCIKIAEKLKSHNISFEINTIGAGEMYDELSNIILQKGLSESVHLLGGMSPENVREHMEKSSIFIFSSDYNEGWGAVLNEAMNSGCAVIASDAIGSSGFLINDGVNGFIYKHNNINDLYRKVTLLLSNDVLRSTVSRNAYFTITNEWNAATAADRVLKLSESIIYKKPLHFSSGPCSKAKPIFRGNIFH